MQTYRFNADTKEFLYAEEAFLDPLETEQQGHDIYLIPADSTFTPPLDEKEGYAVCWNGTAWEYIEDHRQKRDMGGVPIEGTGTAYWMPDDIWQTPARYMKELGPLPEGALLEALAKTDEEVAAETLAQAKAERTDAVSKITVIVDGMVFDGDEISQERMSRTITAAVTTGEDMSSTTTWVLADNTVAQVSIKQLAKALRAAGEKQTSLWTIPYEETPEEPTETPAEEPTTEPETVPETPEPAQPVDTEATA